MRGQFAIWATMPYPWWKSASLAPATRTCGLRLLKQDRVLITLDADFANVLRYPPTGTPGVVRLRLHPAVEEAIDAMLRAWIPRVAEIRLSGKLVVVGERKIRVRG